MEENQNARLMGYPFIDEARRVIVPREIARRRLRHQPVQYGLFQRDVDRGGVRCAPSA